MTVAQWQDVISPADGETYRRKTATGSGTTDPADDSTNYSAVSYTRVTALSSSPFVLLSGSLTYANASRGAVKSTGTIAAGARTMVLSVTGAGVLTHLSDYQESGTKQCRVELFVDGRPIYDQTSSTTGTSNVWHYGGCYFDAAPATTALDGMPIEFKRTLQIYVTPVTIGWTSGSSAICYKIGSTA